MDEPHATPEQPTACLLGAALTHLAQHLVSGCPRSGCLAALLLDQVADESGADSSLGRHARQLVDILECDPSRFATVGRAVLSHRRGALPLPSAGECRP